jgi:hypothetical protein
VEVEDKVASQGLIAIIRQTNNKMLLCIQAQDILRINLMGLCTSLPMKKIATILMSLILMIMRMVDNYIIVKLLTHIIYGLK